jgi:hypothetical protein
MLGVWIGGFCLSGQRIRIRFQRYDKGLKTYRDVGSFVGDAPDSLVSVLSNKVSVDCERGYHDGCRGEFVIMVELLGYVFDLHAFCGCDCHGKKIKAE